MIIVATNQYGSIRIEAGKGSLRTYYWEGGSESVKLRKRTSRLFGSLGLYSPGGGPRVHLVVEEGQQHFCSEKEAREWWLRDQKRLGWAFASNGVVVGWSRSEELATNYRAVCVAVWQIVIDGQNATVTNTPCVWSAWVYNAGGTTEGKINPFFSPSQPRLINGRLFSGKALDLMAERGVDAEEVEQAISNGQIVLTNAPKSGWKTIVYRSWRRVMRVTVDGDGRVVFVLF